MIVGIMSDSHGLYQRVARAAAVLEAVGAKALFHCGDVGGFRVLDELAQRSAYVVWGNTDGHEFGRDKYAQKLGVTVGVEPPLRVELAGKRLALFHGHERVFDWLLQRHVDGAEVQEDYIFHGHTHMARDVRLPSGARVINPGALQRARTPTVASLDLARDELRYWVIDDADALDAPPEPIELA